jgi:hypothetical protein
MVAMAAPVGATSVAASGFAVPIWNVIPGLQGPYPRELQVCTNHRYVAPAASCTAGVTEQTVSLHTSPAKYQVRTSGAAPGLSTHK